jgi:SAM-dependent methyltransferase
LRAWDCATGNGQAARDLARYFDHVVATDASAEQVAQAPRVANVGFAVARAEASGLADRTVDLVTVAQALHWLDFDPFFSEVRRVTVPGGVVAAWSYGSCHAGADIEPLLREFEFHTLRPWWHAGRRWVDDQYRSIPFPFSEVQPPKLQLRLSWTLRQLGTYLSSWSAVASCRRERGKDPVAPLLERIAYHWEDGDSPREVTWPLSLRVGRVT